MIAAWQCISLEVISKGFKKCCVSNAVDETYEDMLWDGSEEDWHVTSECEEGEGTDCEVGDSDTDW